MGRFDFCCAFALIGVVGLPPSASALVLEADLNVAGDGLLTVDVDNKLEFLDLSETKLVTGFNRTFDDVISQLGAGGEFDGFRHATAAEVIALWTSAGIPDIDTGSTAANVAPVNTLIDLLDSTPEDSAFNKFTHGIVADVDGVQPGTHQFVEMNIGKGPTNSARVNSDHGDTPDNMSNIRGGHFLVRAVSAVPEPTCALVLLFTLPLLAGRQRRVC